MNDFTSQFINDKKFDELHKRLSEDHNLHRSSIPKENLEAIGSIIVAFQSLEHTIRSFIGILANISNDQNLVNILTVKSSFKNLISILSALAIDKNFHMLEDLKTLLAKLNKAEEIRNQIVHSVWTSGPRVKTSLKNSGIVHQFEKYTSEELNQIALTISKLNNSTSALKFSWIMHCQKQGNIPNGVAFVTSETKLK